MINKPILSLICCCFFSMMISAAYAQDLSAHQWENRLLLVLTTDLQDDAFQQQVAELRQQEAGLAERKLVIYYIQPETYQSGVFGDHWQSSRQLFKKFKRTDQTLEVVLIGLDGGIKLQQSQLLTCKDLFAIIDGMPMRRNEILKKKKG